MSTKFINNMHVLSEALLQSCNEGHLNVFKWLMKHTAVNANNKSQAVRFTLTTVCEYDYLDVVIYLIEICHVDVNLCM